MKRSNLGEISGKRFRLIEAFNSVRTRTVPIITEMTTCMHTHDMQAHVF